MSKSPELENLPTADLRNEIKKQLGKLGELGFPTGRLDGFTLATSYRRDTLFFEHIRQLQSERGTIVDRSEQDALFAEFAAKYDGLSAENLAEVLRYQYDRETRESSLDRASFPAVDSDEYKAILNVMASLGMYLKELSSRIDNYSLLREILRVISTTPDEILREAGEEIRIQLNLKISDENKAGEIKSSLQILLRNLNKSKLHGDELPVEQFQALEALNQQIELAYAAGNYRLVLDLVTDFFGYKMSFNH